MFLSETVFRETFIFELKILCQLEKNGFLNQKPPLRF
jgi:hypothetical protein